MEIESHGDAGTMGAREVRKPLTEDMPTWVYIVLMGIALLGVALVVIRT